MKILPRNIQHRVCVVLYLILCLFLVFEGKVFAKDTGISGTNLEFYRPAIDPYGYFMVNSHRLLEGGDFYFNLSQSAALRHLFEISVSTTTPGGGTTITSTDIVNHIFTTNFIAALGIADFFTLGVDVPFHIFSREANFTTNNSFSTTSLGDVRMALKFRILKEGKNQPGITFFIDNTFPTGNDMKFLGTSHMVPGAMLVIGKEFKYFDIAANFGARFPQQKNILGIDFNDQITYGIAARVPWSFWDPLFSFIGEIRGHMEPVNPDINNAPIEFTAGIRKEFKNGLTLTAGGGGGWNNAMGNPRARGILSLSYSSHRKSGLRRLAKSVQTTVLFRPSSTHPTSESKQTLQNLALRIQKNSKIKELVVHGHTDSQGSDRANKRLACRRAQMVKKILVERGVRSNLITTESHGLDHPIASNDTYEGRSLNRRAEILVPSKKVVKGEGCL